MITPIVSSVIYSTNIRAVLQLTPSTFKQLWKDWDLRLAILLSLTIQILLSILGIRRKYNRRSWIRIIVWSAYTAADSAAIFAFGIISTQWSCISRYGTRDVSHLDAKLELTTLWSQILLFHVGGPDSTAYALEDNELWMRQLVGVVSQSCGAFYVLLQGWTGSRLSILSILMFIAGLIKCGERAWVLRAASYQIQRKSVLEQPDLDTHSTSKHINYDHQAKMDFQEYKIKTEEGYICGVERYLPVDFSGFSDNSISEEGKVVTAYRFLRATKRLFVDAALTLVQKDFIQTVLRNMSLEDAFEINEIQLGMIYDLRYTKTPVLCSRRGLGLRLITFFFTCSSLSLFCFLDHKHKYSKIDLSITLVLLIVAVVLDIYAALVLLSSDWFTVWMSINNKRNSTMKTLASFPLLKIPRWSNCISQCTLLRFSKKEKPLFFNIGKRKCYQWDTEVTRDLKIMIFRYFRDKAGELSTTGKIPFTALPTTTTTNQNEEQEKAIRGINWEEFEYKIIVWSVMTELTYYMDRENIPNSCLSHCKAIKRISRYMLYLLVNHPSMISTETGLMVFSFQDITNLSKAYSYRDPNCKADASEKFIEHFKEIEYPTEVYLVFKYAIKLAEELKETARDEKEKWERIGNAWLEMLGYATRKSKGNEHAQKLSHGGEFLTHVWLLMVYFSFTNHFLIASKGRSIANIMTK